MASFLSEYITPNLPHIIFLIVVYLIIIDFVFHDFGARPRKFSPYHFIPAFFKLLYLPIRNIRIRYRLNHNRILYETIRQHSSLYDWTYRQLGFINICPYCHSTKMQTRRPHARHGFEIYIECPECEGRITADLSEYDIMRQPEAIKLENRQLEKIIDDYNQKTKER